MSESQVSARRAKFNAKRAARHGKRLPVGAPYRLLPRWVPYWLARLLSRLGV